MSSEASIFDLSLEQLTLQLERWGEPAYRARQIWHGVYQRLVPDPDSMTDIPIGLRDQIKGRISFKNLTEAAIQYSEDGSTEKTLFTLADGLQVEAVLMRYANRNTVCISSQVGCAMGCTFCATGQMGYGRNLSSGEIVEQVIRFAGQLAEQEKQITNVVVMGMGEPFHNYDAVLDALVRLNHPEGFNLGARRFTISTVGLVPGIERFTREGWRFNLAVSLHAATNTLRDQLLPVNRRYPLEALIPACRQYVRRSGRRITFEWALIRGVNDGLDQADALAGLISDFNCHVNLIPLNPTPEFDGDATTKKDAAIFLEKLTRRGISATMRLRRGINIRAGCGQLATDRNPSPRKLLT
jgi:23S rRNA (adenine2503-C2)-methyltransferase